MLCRENRSRRSQSLEGEAGKRVQEYGETGHDQQYANPSKRGKMQKRRTNLPARDPPWHDSGHRTGSDHKKKDRPHNRGDSPNRVRTQRDGALPQSPTFRTLYLGPNRQVASPAGSVTSESELSRFTRKVCIVKQVTSPSRAASDCE